MSFRQLRPKMNELSILIKKRDLKRDADECESRLNDVSSINENELLNDDEFFEMINKKTHR